MIYVISELKMSFWGSKKVFCIIKKSRNEGKNYLKTVKKIELNSYLIFRLVICWSQRVCRVLLKKNIIVILFLLVFYSIVASNPINNRWIRTSSQQY